MQRVKGDPDQLPQSSFSVRSFVPIRWRLKNSLESFECLAGLTLGVCDAGQLTPYRYFRFRRSGKRATNGREFHKPDPRVLALLTNFTGLCDMTASCALKICEHCDSVYTPVVLKRGEVARCVRCACILDRSRRLNIQQHLALTIAAAVMFVFANVFPVITISFQGLNNQAELWQSVSALAQGPISVIAIVAGITIIVAPMLQIVLLCWVLFYALRRRAAPGFKICMRTLEQLRPWSMLEVCLLGVLVTVVKLAGMLDVHPGLGLWALGMLTVLIILISGKDIRRLWDDLEVSPQ